MRKSHPVRRAVLVGAATVSGIVLLLSLKPAADPASASTAAAPPRSSVSAAAPPRGAGASGGTGPRTVTGAVAPTRYGDVQGRLTVNGGRNVRAEAVRAPRGGLSDRRTALAVPRLNQEAVTAQSAGIDAVSGATYTSDGYRRSLQSALDRARG
jgi:uncharacterized protein with FMN-binding domain